MEKPYPVKSSHSPFCQTCGEKLQDCAQRRWSERWGTGGAWEGSEHSSSWDAGAAEPPHAGVLLAKLALPPVVSPGTLSATNQPNVVSQMVGSCCTWRMWVENSLGWIMCALRRSVTPAPFAARRSWVPSAYLSWNGMTCSQVIPSLSSWVLRECRWQTLKLVAPWSCLKLLEAAWSWVGDHGWPGSHCCCGFCTAESGEVVQNRWPTGLSDPFKVVGKRSHSAQRRVCRQSQCGPFHITWAQLTSGPPRPASAALGERHVLLLPSLLLVPRVLCRYQAKKEEAGF